MMNECDAILLTDFPPLVSFYLCGFTIMYSIKYTSITVSSKHMATIELSDNKMCRTCYEADETIRYTHNHRMRTPDAQT